MPLVARSRTEKCLTEQSRAGRFIAPAALLGFAFVLAVLIQPASAQSGSAGGSLGDGEKSLSGSRAPRGVESSAPARPRKPARDRPRAARSSASGGVANFDGAWAVVSVGRPCGGASEAIVISGGRFTGQYTSGTVAPSGQTSGSGSANGISWTSSGRFSARSGSGSFRRSDGCVGSWTASKQ
ncbi:hypothetical protein NML43_03215 [Rhodopseudomonas palustris]|uniref:hypothetical protein n=1 Tax=Rhodopseudomonas palustris TaxID=1076 RepID=UPI0020CDA8C9|nr:hypothetical protein [Rhodopseudomonas palustris]MCP9626096.1 hypothetical protein [Rhodopseudomonas palustris]